MMGCIVRRAVVAPSDPPTSAPLVPIGVSAVEGNGSVTVSWTPAAEATSYNIYYATASAVSKKNGTKLANLSGGPYTVRSLRNKTPYFFVVTAVNAAGESGDSAPVMAAPMARAPRPELVRIPAGPFRMGDNLDQTNYALPVHTVILDEFSIDRYETTYALWKEICDWAVVHGYEFDNAGQNGSTGHGNNLPVVMVSWYDAVKWLNARSEKEGRTPVYCIDDAHASVYRTGRVDLANAQVNWAAGGYRLPTEAEWEKAARGALRASAIPGEMSSARVGRTTAWAAPFPSESTRPTAMGFLIWPATFSNGCGIWVRSSRAITGPARGPRTPAVPTRATRGQGSGGAAAFPTGPGTSSAPNACSGSRLTPRPTSDSDRLRKSVD